MAFFVRPKGFVVGRLHSAVTFSAMWRSTEDEHSIYVAIPGLKKLLSAETVSLPSSGTMEAFE